MDNREFNVLAEEMLARIEAQLEACDADIDFERADGGILTIEFANGSKIIVNRHSAAQEIWVAARSGGFHFRPDATTWIDTRDGEELMTKLSRLASEQAGQSIRFA